MRPRLRNARMFLVQYTEEANPTQGCECGRVEHIQSGTSVRFATRNDFEEFVSRVLREESDQRAQAICREPK